MEKWISKGKTKKGRGRIFTYFQESFFVPQQQKIGQFDLLQFSDWVNIIPVTNAGKIILANQFRVGANNFCWETPGGAIDRKDINPLIAAQRELQEETGMTSNEWIALGSFNPNPAFMTNQCHVFLAKDVKKTHPTQFDPFEEIETAEFTKKDVKNLIQNKKFGNGVALAAYLFFELMDH